MVDLLECDLAEPIEVWLAAKGRAALIAMVRSDAPLSRRARRAMADWLEGYLKPPKQPVGRPVRQVHAEREMSRRIFGHDVYKTIGFAGWRHEKLRQFIRKKGWHRKRAGRPHWPAARLLEAVAQRVGVDVEALANYLKRSRAKTSRT
jgi:hypothetical protein